LEVDVITPVSDQSILLNDFNTGLWMGQIEVDDHQGETLPRLPVRLILSLDLHN
jgi:hypothetical protein